jgi:AraC family transcriptional regulator
MNLLRAKCADERHASAPLPDKLIATQRVTPDQWAGQLSGPADYTSCPERWPTAVMRHWTNTSPQMDQPPLDHHYIAQHLGGPKRIDRKHDGTSVSKVVEEGAITIVPAGTQFKWSAQGPIEFAHLYLSPTVLRHAAARFNRSDGGALIDRVGCRDPLLKALYSSMLAEIRQPLPVEPLYLDILLEALILQLLRDHATAGMATPTGREILPLFRLRRVFDYVESRLADRLALADLAEVAGGSVFHFSRAFKNASGDSPYRYVLRRRTERAKTLLQGSHLGMMEIAIECGFPGIERFAKTFKQFAGTTPLRYRNAISTPHPPDAHVPTTGSGKRPT